jgi:antitoxin YefM
VVTGRPLTKSEHPARPNRRPRPARTFRAPALETAVDVRHFAASGRRCPWLNCRAALRSGRLWATIVAMRTESLRQVRDHLSEVVDRVEREHERVTLTRNGRPAAVLISPDDLAQLEETLEVLGDPEALAEIREADAAYARGDVVRGVEAVRALRR